MSCEDQKISFKNHFVADENYGRGIRMNDLRTFLNEGKALQEDIGFIPQADLSLSAIQDAFRNYNYQPGNDYYRIGRIVNPTVSTTIYVNETYSDSLYELFEGWALYIEYDGLVESRVVLSASLSGSNTEFVIDSAFSSSLIQKLQADANDGVLWPVYISPSSFHDQVNIVNFMGAYRYENEVPTIELIGDQEMTVDSSYAGTTGLIWTENGVDKRAQCFKPIFYPPASQYPNYPAGLPMAARPGRQWGVPGWGTTASEYDWLTNYAWAYSIFIDDSGNGTSGRILFSDDLNWRGGGGGRYINEWRGKPNVVGLHGSWSKDGNHLKLHIPEDYGIFFWYAGGGHNDYFMPVCADDWNGIQINSGCSMRLDNFYSDPNGTFTFSNADQYAYLTGSSGSDGVNGRGYAPFGQWPFKLVETDTNGYPIDAPCSWFDDIRGIGCGVGNYFQDPGATATDPEQGNITHKIRILIRVGTSTGDIIDDRGWYIDSEGYLSYINPDNSFVMEPPDGYIHSNPYLTGIPLDGTGTYYITYYVNDHCYDSQRQNGRKRIEKTRIVHVV